MSRIYQQNSRMSQHTILRSGVTFSVPLQEDYTLTGTSSEVWSSTGEQLVLSEFGVNEADKELFIRIGNEIKQVDVWANPISGTLSGEMVSGTLFETQLDNSKFYKIDCRVAFKPINTSEISGYIFEDAKFGYNVGYTFSVDTTTEFKGSFNAVDIEYRTIGTGSYCTFSLYVNNLPASPSGVSYKCQYKLWTL